MNMTASKSLHVQAKPQTTPPQQGLGLAAHVCSGHLGALKPHLSLFQLTDLAVDNSYYYGNDKRTDGKTADATATTNGTATARHGRPATTTSISGRSDSRTAKQRRDSDEQVARKDISSTTGVKQTSGRVNPEAGHPHTAI